VSAGQAVRDGVRRVNRAPAVLFGMFLLTWLVALPLSIALRGLLAAHLGRSLEAGSAVAGVNRAWWQEFAAQASGLGTTFIPSIIGFGAVLENVSDFLDNEPLATTIAGATAAWLVLWSFLSGGVLDRYARQRATRAHGFFAACGAFFWRFARLGIVALLVYYILFAYVHPWLFEDLYSKITRDMTVERSAFGVRAALYVVFVLLLVGWNIIFDYARVRMVVEDRRSALAAIGAGARFVRRHPGAFGVYGLCSAAYLVLVAVYALASPGAPGSGLAMWSTLVIGELYIVGRHYVKLLFYASQTAYFQGALAHSAYTAAPPVVWPESPAAEAILNADSVSR
jgi:hypothetical protein